METLVWIVHVLSAVAVIGLVLIQHGKGADMGAAFGSGSSGSLFGSTGAANFMSRATAVLATVFFLTSLGLTYISSTKGAAKGVMDVVPAGQLPASSAPAQVAPPVPAVPATAPAADPSSKAGEIPK